MSTSGLLFNGDRIRVSARGEWPGERPCVVTFDCYQFEADPSRPGFGEAFFASRDVDAVHVISHSNDWYQSEEIGPALAVVATALLGRRAVFTYGSSMGGYAALRFAAQLGARGAVAVAPQYSIDLGIAPFDRRWKESATLRFQPELNGRFALPSEPLVIYDPHEKQDAAHVALFRSLGPLVELRLPYAGHSAGLMLAQLGLLGEFVVDFIDGSTTPHALVGAARQRKRESAQYWATLAMHAYPRRAPLASTLVSRAVALRPDYPEYASQLQLYRTGPPAGASGTTGRRTTLGAAAYGLVPEPLKPLLRRLSEAAARSAR